MEIRRNITYVDILLSFFPLKDSFGGVSWCKLLFCGHQHSPELPMVNVMVSKEVYQTESGDSPDTHVIG
jgi:hypothetical protein